LQRPLRRAGDINLSAAISSPAVSKTDTVNAKPNPEADEDGNKEYPGKWQSLDEEYGHLVMAGQRFKICLGSSSVKTQRPTSKLKRAGDIRLSEAISSPVVAKIDASNVRSQQNITPNLHAVKAGAMAVAVDANNIKISLPLFF
jgi:hypothetical protein